MIVSCVVDEAVGTLAGAAVSNGTCTGACVAKRLAKWFRVEVLSAIVEVRGGWRQLARVCLLTTIRRLRETFA
jgi:hypothetical protein